MMDMIHEDNLFATLYVKDSRQFYELANRAANMCIPFAFTL